MIKKTVIALALLASGAVMAAGPQIEPGPQTKLSEDATTVARLLMNRQLEKCVSQIQKSGYDVAWDSVSRQLLNPETTQYALTGTAIEGGDIAVGEVLLSITEKSARGVFGNPTRVLTCEVSLPKHR